MHPFPEILPNTPKNIQNHKNMTKQYVKTNYRLCPTRQTTGINPYLKKILLHKYSEPAQTDFTQRMSS